MKLIPSEKLELTTSFSVAELEEHLKENIQKHRSYKIGSIKKSNKYFVGTVFPGHFKCKKFTYQRNSFLPQVTGIFYEEPTGTKVATTLKIDSFVSIFLILFYAFIICAIFATIYLASYQKIEAYFILVPIGLLLLVFGIPHLGFNLEKDSTITELKKMLTV
ncbi:hypothetical protein [Maribacter litoralis]|uniref:hypothetical protein n=1 Tax=Maribacter litoralis TaxID=2059726 RepID=UPI000E3155AD|nr:hypothetical protein [Maribacter litoralis]